MKKSNTADRLRLIMEQRQLRQVDILALTKPFCDQYNVKLGKNDLSQYVNGKVEPGQTKLTILGLALNVNESWLMGLDVPMERNALHSNQSDISVIPSNDSPLSLSPHERQLILSYRSHPEMQAAVDTLLGLVPAVSASKNA